MEALNYVACSFATGYEEGTQDKLSQLLAQLAPRPRLERESSASIAPSIFRLTYIISYPFATSVAGRLEIGEPLGHHPARGWTRLAALVFGESTEHPASPRGRGVKPQLCAHYKPSHRMQPCCNTSRSLASFSLAST